MKTIRYKGVTVEKPDNISMNLLKKFIDDVGKDCSFDVSSVMAFISNNVINKREKRDTDLNKPNNTQ